jgi:hypothetical protein
LGIAPSFGPASAGPPAPAASSKALNRENSEVASSEDDQAPMSKALRVQGDGGTPKKTDGKQAAAAAGASPQEALEQAAELLIKFRDEVCNADLLLAGTTVKKGEKKPTCFDDLLGQKNKEIDIHVTKCRKKNLMVIASNLMTKSNLLTGARLVFGKAKVYRSKQSEANRRAFQTAVAVARSKHELDKKDFPYCMKEMLAEVSKTTRDAAEGQ